MPDRELDAWLAEHLFGWHVEGNRRGNWQLVSPSGDVGVMYRRGEQPTYIGYQVKNLPLYSSTGAGMLLVLEALRTRGLVVELFGNRTTWIARVDEVCGASRHTIGHGTSFDSAPSAVAEAARYALEAKP